MKKITKDSIRDYLKELRRTKSKHPEILNEVRNYWKCALKKAETVTAL